VNYGIETEKKGFFPFRLRSKQSDVVREEEELKQELIKIKKELDLAYNNFEYATEKELIDSCIYKMMALQIKYKYFLDKAKEKENSIEKGLEQTS
jgi:hypothetical protein